ncbi:MAG: serine/threonine-protein kinase, partial [Planctomycetaceae bacterium]
SKLELLLKTIPRDNQCLPHGESDSPQKIKSFEVITEIGRGGLGTVYLVYDHATGHERVLKVLNGDYPHNHRAIKKCLQSIKSLNKLGTASLNTAAFIADTGSQPCLLGNYEQGIDLNERVRTCGPLSVPDACRAITQAAIALQKAHSVSVLHLNVKPANLFVNHVGQIMVLDCGLAAIVQDTLAQADITTSVFVKESVNYMSPEQARNVSTADHRSDIYSLGCSLAFLISGRTLFEYDSPLQTIVAHRSESPPEVSGLTGDTAANLNQVVIRLLAKHPADRYQSMQAVAAALEPFLGDGLAVGDIISQPSIPSPARLLNWLHLKSRRRH